MGTIATIVWNRACYGGGEQPRAGDAHLAALLHFHGAAMNGGVLHAIQFCSKKELNQARQGYAYLGLAEVSALISKAVNVLATEDSPGDFERDLDSEYSRTAGDSILTDRFQDRYEGSPEDFAPVQ
jgi:hypothetical protein